MISIFLLPIVVLFLLSLLGIAIVVGVLLPLFLELYELIPQFIGQRAIKAHNPWVSSAATLSVLAGGFVLRYVVAYAGQVAKIVTVTM